MKNPDGDYNWTVIEAEYTQRRDLPTLEKLAVEHNVSIESMKLHCSAGNWVQKKADYWAGIAQGLRQENTVKEVDDRVRLLAIARNSANLHGIVIDEMVRAYDKARGEVESGADPTALKKWRERSDVAKLRLGDFDGAARLIMRLKGEPDSRVALTGMTNITEEQVAQVLKVLNASSKGPEEEEEGEEPGPGGQG